MAASQYHHDLQYVDSSALDVSVQVAADIEQNRAQLEKHWKSRLERAQYEADRARRQYDAVEPENRLVARTIEQEWEERLRTLQQLEQEHRRFQQDQPQQLSADELNQIRQLASDLPALWELSETTDQDRKLILRQVIESVVVHVEGDTEWIEIQVHWAGGKQSYSRVRRPVAALSQLSRWPELIERLGALKAAKHSSSEIADILHGEGFRPPKGERITSQIVRVWLSRNGLTESKANPGGLAENEWTIPDLVKRYRVSSSTIHGWIRRGQIQAHQIGGRGGRWVVQASPGELDRLVNNQRNHSHSADLQKTDQPNSGDESCFNGGSAITSAR